MRLAPPLLLLAALTLAGCDATPEIVPTYVSGNYIAWDGNVRLKLQIMQQFADEGPSDGMWGSFVVTSYENGREGRIANVESHNVRGSRTGDDLTLVFRDGIYSSSPTIGGFDGRVMNDATRLSGQLSAVPGMPSARAGAYTFVFSD